MPRYIYQAIEAKGCAYCSKSFEIQQSIHDKALEKCPRCGAPVSRLIFAVSTLKSSRTKERESDIQPAPTQEDHQHSCSDHCSHSKKTR